jgi:hypothetical protein
MRLPIFAALGVIIALAGMPVPAPAQPADRAIDPAPRRAKPPPRQTPPRIEGAATEDTYRHCVGGYAIEHRATGDTIVPRLRCWWARGK